MEGTASRSQIQVSRALLVQAYASAVPLPLDEESDLDMYAAFGSQTASHDET